VYLLSQGQSGNGSLAREVQVQARSGDVLSVTVRLAPGGRGMMEEVILRGTAHRVFEGEVAWPLQKRRG
jgi:hypothetical protein